MSTPTPADVTFRELVDIKGKEGVLVVDVREPVEIQETGKLPGSIHIPLGDLKGELQASAEEFKARHGVEKPTPDTQLVFSCRSGKRSRTAVDQALALDFKGSRNFEGGFLNWEKNSNK